MSIGVGGLGFIDEGHGVTGVYKSINKEINNETRSDYGIFIFAWMNKDQDCTVLINRNVMENKKST